MIYTDYQNSFFVLQIDFRYFCHQTKSGRITIAYGLRAAKGYNSEISLEIDEKMLREKGYEPIRVKIGKI
jgi:hypothetical protein